MSFNDHLFNSVENSSNDSSCSNMSYEKEGHDNENCQVIYDEDSKFENIELSHQSLNSLVLDALSQSMFQVDGYSSTDIITNDSHLEWPKCHHGSNFFERKSIPILDLDIIQVPILGHSLESHFHSQVDATNIFYCNTLDDTCEEDNFPNKSQLFCNTICNNSVNGDVIFFACYGYFSDLYMSFIFQFLDTLCWHVE